MLNKELDVITLIKAIRKINLVC